MPAFGTTAFTLVSDHEVASSPCSFHVGVRLVGDEIRPGDVDRERRAHSSSPICPSSSGGTEDARGDDDVIEAPIGEDRLIQHRPDRLRGR